MRSLRQTSKFGAYKQKDRLTKCPVCRGVNGLTTEIRRTEKGSKDIYSFLRVSTQGKDPSVSTLQSTTTLVRVKSHPTILEHPDPRKRTKRRDKGNYCEQNTDVTLDNYNNRGKYQKSQHSDCPSTPVEPVVV